MKLKSMLSEKKPEEQQALPVMCDPPKYPYGLCLNLDEESIKKLGLKELPEVGSYLMMSAKVEVVGVSKHESKEESNRNLSLQITDMDLEGSKKEEEQTTATALYRDVGLF